MNLPPYLPCAVPLYRVRPVLPSSRLAVLFSRREFGLVDVGHSRQEGNAAVGREWGVVSDGIPHLPWRIFPWLK